MAMKFLGSDFQINADGSGAPGAGPGNGILGTQQLPQVTALSDGRFAVVYQSVFTPGGDQEVDAAIFNANGTVSKAFIDVDDIPNDQTQSVLAQLPGGGFGVAFIDQNHSNQTADGNTNINYVRVQANGTPAAPLAIFDLASNAVINPAIATLTDGRQVVVVEAVVTPGTDDDLGLNVVSANGTSTAVPPDASQGINVASTPGVFESRPRVAALGTNALIAFIDATGTTIASQNIAAVLFNGSNNTVGTRFLVADHAAGLFTTSVTALDSHRYLITYGDGGTDIFGKIYDTNSSTLSPELQIDQPGGGNSAVSIAVTADGGFIATWQRFLNGNVDIVAQRFNSDGGTMGQEFTVNRLTDGSQFFPTVAVSGANAFFAWTDTASRPTDTSPSSIRGQVMTLTTPPDFTGDGVSDILWRNTSGEVAAWFLNSNGTIGGSADLTSGGVAIAPDPTYSVAGISDFNGDGKADILWRNTQGSLIEWLMNGSVIASSGYVTSNGVPVNPEPTWSFGGAGDFNGDGISDMLWRNSSGEVAIWQMNGSVIAGSGDTNAGGGPISLDASWSTAGIGDFNGDGKADIVWRNTTTGEVAMWLMNGSTVIGSGDVKAGGAAVIPGPTWSVAGVGDFNADGNADLLWRDSSSGALVEWLMNGTTIIGSSSVTAGGVVVNPDPSWHVVEIGDFNGDARADILWRNDNASMAEWFMKGTAIIGSGAPTAGGAAITLDPSWQTQPNQPITRERDWTRKPTSRPLTLIV